MASLKLICRMDFIVFINWGQLQLKIGKAFVIWNRGKDYKSESPLLQISQNHYRLGQLLKSGQIWKIEVLLQISERHSNQKITKQNFIAHYEIDFEICNDLLYVLPLSKNNTNVLLSVCIAILTRILNILVAYFLVWKNVHYI